MYVENVLTRAMGNCNTTQGSEDCAQFRTNQATAKAWHGMMWQRELRESNWLSNLASN